MSLAKVKANNYFTEEHRGWIQYTLENEDRVTYPTKEGFRFEACRVLDPRGFSTYGEVAYAIKALKMSDDTEPDLSKVASMYPSASRLEKADETAQRFIFGHFANEFRLSAITFGGRGIVLEFYNRREDSWKRVWLNLAQLAKLRMEVEVPVFDGADGSQSKWLEVSFLKTEEIWEVVIEDHETFDLYYLEPTFDGTAPQATVLHYDRLSLMERLKEKS